MEDSPDTTIAIYAAIFAGLSALAGIAAAVAAWRSANTAKSIAETGIEEEKRRHAIELAKLAQEILSKGKSSNRLCDEVKQQYQSLAVFAGQVGGSRSKLFQDRVEKTRSEIAQIVHDVETASVSGESVEAMSEARIAELLTTFVMKHEELLELTSVLKSEKSELQSQLASNQKKAIDG